LASWREPRKGAGNWKLKDHQKNFVPKRRAIIARHLAQAARTEIHILPAYPVTTRDSGMEEDSARQSAKSAERKSCPQDPINIFRKGTRSRF
jgi:hypothetical protein